MKWIAHGCLGVPRQNAKPFEKKHRVYTIPPRIYTSYTQFHPCYQDIWAFAVDAPHLSPKVWSPGVDRSIGNSYLRAHACLHASFHRKVPLEMLPPVGQGCWDEIYSSTSEPEPTAATSLTPIRECIYGWLVAHFCTPDSFLLWLCAGGQEAGMAPTFTYTFSYLLQLFWCLSSNDFHGPANILEHVWQWSTCIFDGSHRTTVTSKRRGSRSRSKQSELRKQLETAAEQHCVW
jgi:hypothetical protein